VSNQKADAYLLFLAARFLFLLTTQFSDIVREQTLPLTHLLDGLEALILAIFL
jgi:hypothetical protein